MLNNRNAFKYIEDNLETRNRLLKTLDILTLIVLDLRKRRTKPEGVCYPPITEEKEKQVEEKMEHKLIY